MINTSSTSRSSNQLRTLRLQHPLSAKLYLGSLEALRDIEAPSEVSPGYLSGRGISRYPGVADQDRNLGHFSVGNDF